MADRYLLESGTPDGFLLEDSSGVLSLEVVEEPAAVAKVMNFSDELFVAKYWLSILLFVWS